MTCKFCDEPAVDGTWPPLCLKHLDLVVITEYLDSKKQPVTIEAVQEMILICRARNGLLYINVEEVEPLMTTLEFNGAGFSVTEVYDNSRPPGGQQ